MPRKFYPHKLSWLICILPTICVLCILRYKFRDTKSSIKHEENVKMHDTSRTLQGAEDVVYLPSKQIMANMSYEKLSSLYHRYVNNVQVRCSSIIRLGTLDDGGWDVCGDDGFMPHINNCLVYSFGIDYDFSFDEDVATRYNCQVHSFDPSMAIKEYNKNKRISFHQIGLADVNEKLRGKLWDMKTLQQTRKELGHLTVPIDILKLDIEEWEWFAIPEMIASNSLRDVRQLIVEFHLSIREIPDYKRYLRCLYTLKDLFDIGFRIIWTHRNLWCNFRWEDVERTGCHELSFIRVN